MKPLQTSVLLLAFAFLGHSGSWAADRLDRTYDHFDVREKDDAVGCVQFGRDKVTGCVIEAFVSIPTRLIAEQAQPWSHWHEHPQLKYVHVQHSEVSAAFLRYLASLKAVRCLYIDDCCFENEAIHSLGEIRQLCELTIATSEQCRINDWAFLKKLNGLKSLSIGGHPVGGNFAEQFDSLSSLKVLRFTVANDSAGRVLPKLIELPSAVSIDISWSRSNPRHEQKPNTEK